MLQSPYENGDIATASCSQGETHCSSGYVFKIMLSHFSYSGVIHLHKPGAILQTVWGRNGDNWRSASNFFPVRRPYGLEMIWLREKMWEIRCLLFISTVLS